MPLLSSTPKRIDNELIIQSRIFGNWKGSFELTDGSVLIHEPEGILYHFH